MNKKIKIILAFGAITGMMLLAGCGLKSTGVSRYPVKLEVWGNLDDSDVFNDIFGAYEKANPNVQLSYRKMNYDTYEQDLVSALATGQGPDIFLIRNSWVPKFKDKITPVTPDILLEQKFRNDFVDVAAFDFIDQGQIYAAPLSVDSLGLYYNKDLFNQAGITAPPKNWNDFVDDVRRLTRIDSFGQIIQSGAALGTTENINRPTDILNLLLLQNKTQMVDEQGARATFDQMGRSGNASSFSGENALNFYTQFSKANAATYSWNSKLHYSIDAFSENTLAMMLNYSWQIETIRNKAPKLNFAIAPVPQLDEAHPINYANYWGFAVANNKIPQTFAAGSQQVQVPNNARVAESWRFLKFLTVKPEVDPANPAASTFDAAADYAEKTQKLAARKDLIESQKNDVELGPFALGNLVAKNWKQVDPAAVESIFTEMINSVNSGANTPAEALEAAAARVTQTMSR